MLGFIDVVCQVCNKNIGKITNTNFSYVKFSCCTELGHKYDLIFGIWNSVIEYYQFHESGKKTSQLFRHYHDGAFSIQIDDIYLPNYIVLPDIAAIKKFILNKNNYLQLL